jgi:hypothetical protein
MDDLGRLVLLLALGGAALTLMGGAAVWLNGEQRMIRRGLRKVLGEEPHALLVAEGRGRGVGFNFTSNTLAVAWDAGAWCMVYRLDELIGAEAIVDSQVAGRVYRGEGPRPLNHLGGASEQVRLRLVFEDPAYPDFDLDLWHAGASGRGQASPSDALNEANRWLSRVEAMLRRGPARRAAVAVALDRDPPVQTLELDPDEGAPALS